jgi:hypothetical protein
LLSFNQQVLIPIIDKALEGDIEEARSLVTDHINGRIDIPGIPHFHPFYKEINAENSL